MIGKILIGLLVVIGVSSYKYLPGAYSTRFYWIAVKYLFFKKVNSKSPFAELKRDSKCCLLECDFFGLHKNNGTYFTELDLARTDCTLNIIHSYFKNSVFKNEKLVFVPLASISNHFIKDIKPFENYSISTKIVGWGNKWIWLISIFTIDEKVKFGNSGNVGNVGSNEIPEYIPPMYLDYKQDDKFGKRICCISVGKLVFKLGRTTILPWDIIKSSNDGNNEVVKVQVENLNKIAFKNEVEIGKFINNPVELLKIYENL